MAEQAISSRSIATRCAARGAGWISRFSLNRRVGIRGSENFRYGGFQQMLRVGSAGSYAPILGQAQRRWSDYSKPAAVVLTVWARLLAAVDGFDHWQFIDGRFGPFENEAG